MSLNNNFNSIIIDCLDINSSCVNFEVTLFVFFKRNEGKQFSSGLKILIMMHHDDGAYSY